MRDRSSIVVGVLRGGPSAEYDVSLRTGANVLNALRDRYKVRDILIDRDGRWHIDGLERLPARILPHLDVTFIALHGNYGEDGRVQQILDSFNVPYTGAQSLPSALGMNKWLSKKFFREHKINTPRAVIFDSNARPDEHTLNSIIKDFGGTVIVKPVSAGSSVGIGVARDARELARAMTSALVFSPDVLLEEFIAGREATVATLESLERDAIHALPPVEIRNESVGVGFWDYDSKYDDNLHELVCPGNFSAEERFILEDYAIRAHKALGLRHYSRSDFIVSPRGVYILETNSLPGLTSSSLVPAALKAAGVHLHEFLDHVLDLALGKK